MAYGSTARGLHGDPQRSVVLLVEDEAAVRGALLGALEVADFEAVGAADVMEALAMLAQRRVAVVVADYHLPGIAGLDLLAAIRGTAPGAALILYSGGMTEALAAEAGALGVRAVLEKPVTAARLVEAVRAALSAGR